VVTVLDVGAGAAIHLRLPGGRSWLVDGGGLHSDSFDFGQLVVGPALWARKMRQVQTVVLTHPHPDHFRGLSFIVANFSPRTFVYPGQPSDHPQMISLLDMVSAKGLNSIGLARLHQGLDLGQVRLKALWPPPDFLKRPGRPAWFDNPNETSLVLMATHGRVRFLLAADIEARAEAALCRLHDQGLIDLRAQVLYVPHHGGRTSAGRPFLARVRPELAVVSCGHGRWPLQPHPQTLRRLEESGARVLRTDRRGAVTVVSDGQGFEARTALDRPRLEVD